MVSKLLLTIVTLLPLAAFAYTQDYVSGSAATSPAPAPVPSQPKVPNIFVTPNSTPAAPAPTPNTQAAPQTSQQLLQHALAQQQQQQPTANQTPATTTASNSIPTTAANTQSAPSNPSGFTEDEKQAWFSSCTKAVQNRQVTQYAQEFCQCGWDHISSGSLTPQMLMNNDQKDAQLRGMILKGISQQCIVQVMANHKLR